MVTESGITNSYQIMDRIIVESVKDEARVNISSQIIIWVGYWHNSYLGSASECVENKAEHDLI